MYELKNNSEVTLHLRRPDLGLNFDLPAGKSYVVTDRQAHAMSLYEGSFDYTVTPSSAKEPSEETVFQGIDRGEAVRGVARSGAIMNHLSQSYRPGREKDTGYNLDFDRAQATNDDEREQVAKEEAKKAATAKAKSDKALDSIEDDKAKKTAKKNIEKEEKEAKESEDKNPVVANKAVDLGDLVPAANM